MNPVLENLHNRESVRAIVRAKHPAWYTTQWGKFLAH